MGGVFRCSATAGPGVLKWVPFTESLVLVAKNDGVAGSRHGRSFEMILVPEREAI